MTVDQLNEEFSIPDALSFDNDGLISVDLLSDSAEARVFLHGAHVAYYQRRGERPVLFMSSKSNFEAGKPIRGGVPICWPWFGGRGPTPESPMHGFARTMEWEVESTHKSVDGAVS